MIQFIKRDGWMNQINTQVTPGKTEHNYITPQFFRFLCWHRVYKISSGRRTEENTQPAHAHGEAKIENKKRKKRCDMCPSKGTSSVTVNQSVCHTSWGH